MKHVRDIKQGVMLLCLNPACQIYRMFIRDEPERFRVGGRCSADVCRAMMATLRPEVLMVNFCRMSFCEYNVMTFYTTDTFRNRNMTTVRLPPPQGSALL